MLVHTGKYRREDKCKIHIIQKLNITQKQQIMQNTAKQNEPTTFLNPHREVDVDTVLFLRQSFRSSILM